MPNATNSQLSVIDELKIQINDIKQKIKEGELSTDVFDTLSKGAKVLQNKLDTLLSKGGIYTQSDVNDAYATMQEVQKKTLELEALKSKYRLYIYVGVAFAIGLGIYLYVKKK
jgi:hypothetical protein